MLAFVFDHIAVDQPEPVLEVIAVVPYREFAILRTIQGADFIDDFLVAFRALQRGGFQIRSVIPEPAVLYIGFAGKSVDTNFKGAAAVACYFAFQGEVLVPVAADFPALFLPGAFAFFAVFFRPVFFVGAQPVIDVIGGAAHGGPPGIHAESENEGDRFGAFVTFEGGALRVCGEGIIIGTEYRIRGGSRGVRGRSRNERHGLQYGEQHTRCNKCRKYASKTSMHTHRLPSTKLVYSIFITAT
ncbi:hypothetical protein [Actinotignum sp. GS-2025b]|uniref:hypothetical protein n=1 Tax=Actinotignum sp. GS-2025b TaxID=3427275 RepID=UPI003F4851B7